MKAAKRTASESEVRSPGSPSDSPPVCASSCASFLASSMEAGDAALERRKVVGVVGSARGKTAVIQVENKGDKAIKSGTMGVSFGTGAEAMSVSVPMGALEAGQTLELSVPIPEGASGGVKAKTQEVVL